MYQNPIQIYSYDGEEIAGCLALFVFLVSRGCCVALSRDVTGFCRFWLWIVVFPDHTHLLKFFPSTVNFS